MKCRGHTPHWEHFYSAAQDIVKKKISNCPYLSTDKHFGFCNGWGLLAVFLRRERMIPRYTARVAYRGIEMQSQSV